MKIPDIFKPEKNLEKKTEKLLQEKKNIPNPKPTGELQKEIEKLLNDLDGYDSIDNNRFNTRIDDIIRKSDYQRLNVKGCYWQYWSRPSTQNFDESCVFIRALDKHNQKRYAFARVDNYKLEDFCRLFEKYWTGMISGINYNKSYFHLGITIGGLGGSIVTVLNPSLIGTATLLLPLASFVAGAFAGTYIARYKHKGYAKKLVRHYEELQTYSLPAIRKAFETK